MASFSVTISSALRFAVWNSSAAANVAMTIASDGEAAHYMATSATNSVETMLTLQHTSSGTVTHEFGSSVMFAQEGNSGSVVDAAQIAIPWIIATNGAESAMMRFSALHAGGYLGYWGLYAMDAIVASVDVIPGGTWDVTKLLYYTAVVWEESGAGVGGPTGTLTPGNTVDLYDDGTDVLTLAIDAGGEVTVSKTAGADSFGMVIGLLWA
jgi:hypothetical protein